MSGQEQKGGRGYHHGNLREALIETALSLIAKHGPAGFAFSDVARAVGSVRRRRTGISATATRCSPRWRGAASRRLRPSWSAPGTRAGPTR